MTKKTPDEELEALKADIASLREELAGLAADVKKFAEIHAEQARAAAQREGPTPGGEGHGVWADLLREFDSHRRSRLKNHQGPCG